MLTEDGRYNYIAYLLADSNGVSIKVAKYAGKDKYDLIENEEYGYCSLIKATKSVLDRLNVENRTLTKITSKERIEKRLMDPLALKEAVINAIVHNDYSLEVPPVFEIYADRLEITSYGGLPMGLSEEDFFACRSMPRNRELMRVFKDLDLVEQLGSGMTRILSAYPKEIFSFTSHFMTVKYCYPEGYTPKETHQETHQETDIDSLADKIMDYCKVPRTNNEIASHFQFKDSRFFFRTHIRPLIQQELLFLTYPDNPKHRNQKYYSVSKKEVD